MENLLEEARAWLAGVGPTSAIFCVWVMLKRQLLMMHQAQLAALNESLARLERAMTSVASELVTAGKRLGHHD